MTELPVRENTHGRLAHLDGMRAFAVLLVVVAHAGLGHLVPGGSGVTIFFAVSGFIITHLVLRERDRTGGFDVGGFYVRRAVKLLPPLLVAILLPTLVWSVWHPVDWSALAAQLFFYFNWTKASGAEFDALPGSGVVWSLSIEEQFYIVFALSWLLLVRRRWARTALAVVSAVVCCGSLGALRTFGGGEACRVGFGG